MAASGSRHKLNIAWINESTGTRDGQNINLVWLNYPFKESGSAFSLKPVPVILKFGNQKSNIRLARVAGPKPGHCFPVNKRLFRFLLRHFTLPFFSYTSPDLFNWKRAVSAATMPHLKLKAPFLEEGAF